MCGESTRQVKEVSKGDSIDLYIAAACVSVCVSVDGKMLAA